MATYDEFGCPKCGKFGCACDPTCGVCHRAKSACICQSHVKLDPKQIAGKVTEAMNLYYNRDAVGLERWVREQFKD